MLKVLGRNTAVGKRDCYQLLWGRDLVAVLQAANGLVEFLLHLVGFDLDGASRRTGREQRAKGCVAIHGRLTSI